MHVINSKKWSPYSIQQAWLGTLCIIFIAFALRYFLHPLVEPFVVFHFFIVACLGVQYLYGYKFSIFSIGISVLLGEFYFVKPYESFDDLSMKDLIISLNFSLVTLIAVIFMESLSRAAYTRDLLFKALESRHKISLYNENDRLFESQKSSHVEFILHEILENFDQILFIKLGGFEYKVGPLFLEMTEQDEYLNLTKDWKKLIHSDDIELLNKIFIKLTTQNNNSSEICDLRFLHPNLGIKNCHVRIEYFHFMNKKILLVRRES